MSSSRKTPAVKSTADARPFDFDSDNVLAADGGMYWVCAAYLIILDRRQRSYTLPRNVVGMRSAALERYAQDAALVGQMDCAINKDHQVP
jgi:hypothetical protein